MAGTIRTAGTSYVCRRTASVNERVTFRPDHTQPMPTPPPLDRRKFFGSAAALSLSAASYANVPGSNDRVRVAFLGCGGRAQAHVDLINRSASEGKPVAAAAVCDVWDGLEAEYEVQFGAKGT